MRTVNALPDLPSGEPRDSDPVREGAAWLRQLHRLLAATFPNLREPVQASAADLNQLRGVSLSGFARTTDVPQKASQSEAEAGTDDSRYMTPLKTWQQGTARIASQSEAQAGASNDRFMSPLRTFQAIDARLATQSEAEAGADNSHLMTPLRTAQAVAAQRTAPDYSATAAIAVNTDLVFNHNLGARPREVRVWLECLTSDLGYAVGDLVPIAAVASDSGNIAWTLAVGGSRIAVRFSATPRLLRLGSSGRAAITPGNWQLRVEALR